MEERTKVKKNISAGQSRRGQDGEEKSRELRKVGPSKGKERGTG